MAEESLPRINFAAADVNSGNPVMGKYSWSMLGLESNSSLAWKSG